MMHYSDEPSGYDTAQVCLNDHAVNSCAITQPEFNAPFCKDCGARTILGCATCQTPIRGDFHVPGVVSLGTFQRTATHVVSRFPGLTRG